MTTQAQREHRESLEALARGKYCRKCDGHINIAYIAQEYVLRCRCHPDAPVLARPESPIERYWRTGEGDSVIRMQAERAELKRAKRAREEK